MMDRIDRVQVAVNSTKEAAKTFHRLLGTEIAREAPSRHLSAVRTILALGESEIELCEPDGAGLVADFIADRGEGLMTAGMSCAEPAKLAERIRSLGYSIYDDGNQFYLPADEHFGTPFVISQTRPLNRVGPVSFLFEVTPVFLTDWRLVATHFAGLLGLDPSRFVQLQSKAFGYDGSLTMFKTPDRLDRLELAQVVRDDVPMARWVERNGDSLYMCSCETHDIKNLVERFMEAGVLWIPRGTDMEKERDGFWTHPKDLHGLLMGVSRTTVPWEFSGHPEFADPPSIKSRFEPD
jgi:hypothetical protein